MGARWDFENKLYYNSILFANNPQNSISFKLNDADTIKEFTFNALTTIEEDIMKRIRETKFQARWLEKDSAIIIKIPRMIYSQNWLEQLKS